MINEICNQSVKINHFGTKVICRYICMYVCDCMYLEKCLTHINIKFYSLRDNFVYGNKVKFAFLWLVKSTM